MLSTLKTTEPSLTRLPVSCYKHEADVHSITIAKPGITNYQALNYLDYYVRQNKAVLDFVLKQPWADARKVVVTGGSEGYEVGDPPRNTKG